MSSLLRTSVGALLVFAALGLQVQTAGAGSTPVSAASKTFLVGTLGFEGGPYPGGFHPTAGAVLVSFKLNPLVLEKTVGMSGHFKIPLGAGTYTVTGCGPKSSASSTRRCGRPKTIKLRAGERRHLLLVWMYAP
jgi:hypothetical protein